MWKQNRKHRLSDKSVYSPRQIEKMNYKKKVFRQKIQVSSNLEQVVMFCLISKNFIELKIIYIRDYL